MQKKKYTGCYKSTFRGCEQNVWKKNHRVKGKSQEISGMGCLKIFRVKGKNCKGGG